MPRFFLQLKIHPEQNRHLIRNRVLHLEWKYKYVRFHRAFLKMGQQY